MSVHRSVYRFNQGFNIWEEYRGLQDDEVLTMWVQIQFKWRLFYDLDWGKIITWKYIIVSSGKCFAWGSSLHNFGDLHWKGTGTQTYHVVWLQAVWPQCRTEPIHQFHQWTRQVFYWFSISVRQHDLGVPIWSLSMNSYNFKTANVLKQLNFQTTNFLKPLTFQNR